MFKRTIKMYNIDKLSEPQRDLWLNLIHPLISYRRKAIILFNYTITPYCTYHPLVVKQIYYPTLPMQQ